jgi:hypothetical protein
MNLGAFMFGISIICVLLTAFMAVYTIRDMSNSKKKKILKRA